MFEIFKSYLIPTLRLKGTAGSLATSNNVIVIEYLCL